MEILRVSLPFLPCILLHTCFQENRLAQLATVDQQRELMRYMRGLNEWLERDVHDRQSELHRVVARVDQLSHDIRGMRAQQGKDSSMGFFKDETHLYKEVHLPDPTTPQRSMKLDLAFLSQPLSSHSHLYDTLLSYHLLFQKLLDSKDLSFRHRRFLKGQVFPNHKPSPNLSPLPPFRLECLHSFLTDQDRSGHFQLVERQRVGQFLYLQIFRLQVVTVQASLVQHILCHPPQFLDHTLQTLEKLFTFHLALLVQAAPVQIHIGGVVLDMTPEGPTLK